ncbi:M48 family metallopeptidase [Salidesulfovibrio onnuriiensis]|uniref:M48 family metallopeptidase n=1 Tax=Salidesulfovibrio onnuriiensis TaxID=2583823 RepID=UPI0011CA610B|nr:M48 family metallopeptidase [Salidesulfovibrio onnuriiensis]
MIKSRLFLYPLLALLAWGLLLPPVPAQALFDGLSIKDEKEMGRKFDRMIRAQLPIVGDPMIDGYIKRIVDRIVAAKDPMPFPVKSAVIRHDAMNAFAIPGGYIYVFTGLISKVESECELAGVIAHELGHASQRHMAARMEKASKIGLASMLGTVAGIFLGAATNGSSGAKAGMALAMGSQAAAHTAMLSYSRDDERDADHVGLNALIKAGYNPRGMPQMFEIMQKNKWFMGQSDIPSYLSTHPGLDERITYLNTRIDRLPAQFTERKDDNTELKRVQAIIMAKLTQADSALGHYLSIPLAQYTALDFMGRGIALQRLKRMGEAKEYFTKALAMDDKDPLVLREAGRFFYKTGDAKRAGALLQKAVIMNPKDALALFYLSLLQAENGDYERAIPAMRKVLKEVPEDGEVHYYLGKILGESGDQFNGYLHLAYSEVYYMNPGRANQHYQKASALAKTEADKEALEKLKETMDSYAKK